MYRAYTGVGHPTDNTKLENILALKYIIEQDQLLVNMRHLGYALSFRSSDRFGTMTITYARYGYSMEFTMQTREEVYADMDLSYTLAVLLHWIQGDAF